MVRTYFGSNLRFFGMEDRPALRASVEPAGQKPREHQLHFPVNRRMSEIPA